MDNYSQIINDLDEDFLNNFLEQVHEEIAIIETNLMFVHTATDCVERLENVYQSIQKIEMLCRIGFLDPLIVFMKKAEVTIENMRTGVLEVSPQLVEVFLLMIDLLRTASEDMIKIRVLDVQLLHEFGERIDEINYASGEAYLTLLGETQLQFSIRVRKDVVFSAFEGEVEGEDVFGMTCALEDTELSNFWDLADALEYRFSHWKERNRKILGTCLLINRYLCDVVDSRQLTAAVYLHDIGMGLLPDELVFKETKYNSEELMLMQNHPRYAYDILSVVPGFEEAANMVFQHHEWFNGNGYPAGLRYGDIVAGAQIISIADTFYALTHNRPDRSYSKSIVRALSEINRSMGTQFDPQVVEAINSVSVHLLKLSGNE